MRHSLARFWRAQNVVLSLMLLWQWHTAHADNPAAYLEFESHLDGRCQILSAGGKLRVLRNTHAARPIAFRLIRTFAGVRQTGRAMGVAGPDGEPVKLGCTRVDGRLQDWRVERAEFSQ